MRKAVLMGMLACLSLTAGAQTWSEWFRQKKTQIKYLVEQIAALNVYKGYVEKGYAVAKNGLHAIGDIKDGDLSMHTNYLASLRRINPSVKGYWKVAGTVFLQARIMALYRKKKREPGRSGQFTAAEVALTDKVLTALLTDCSGLLDQLLLLTRDDASEMKDDERLKAIDKIYKGMEEAYAFVRAFASENSVLSVQRLKEQAGVSTSRSLLNIH